MTTRVPRHSHLRFGTLLSVDGIEFWDVLDLPTIPQQPDDLTYQVLGTDRMDLLANRFYRDPRLWWVIAVANDIELIPTAFNAGDSIRIPSPRYVLQELFKKGTKQRG
jgi:hypothetical protein